MAYIKNTKNGNGSQSEMCKAVADLFVYARETSKIENSKKNN